MVLPLAVAAVLFAIVGPSLPLGAGLLVLTLLPLVLTARVEASRAAQIVLGIALFGGAITVLVTVLAARYTPPEQLRTPWAALAGASLVVAVSRLYLRNPMGGDAGTLAVAICAMTGMGGAQTEWIYPAFVLLFLGTAALARRRADAGRAPTDALLERPHALRGAAILAICAVLAAGVVASLPPLHHWAMDRILMRVSARSGFSQLLWLGSMRGMLMSDRKVLRVHGEDVDYLRGLVYTEYHDGRWIRGADDEPTTRRPVEELVGPDLVELQIVESEPSRYFVPLEAGDIAVSSGIARIDRHGVIAPIAAEPADRIQFRRSGERAYPLAPPDAGDLQVPHSLRRLRPLAKAWAEGAESEVAIAEAVESRLQADYTYALEFERRGQRDPIYEFLVEDKTGHCEYFASAMAVLMRLNGVPTRLVAGYRVTERNPWSDYYIVRERNAHTWVEVYLPNRGWTTFDPTPASELGGPASATSFFGGAVDVIGSLWASFLSWLDRRSWLEMLGVPSVAIVAPLMVRILIRRRRQSRAESADPYAMALPCFVRLTDTLARHRGIVRRASETVNQLAARVAQSSDELVDVAPELLRRYAALRYGGVGDERQLSSDIDAFCQTLERHR